MSEMHIRINKRTVERAVFMMIIIGLAVVVLLQDGQQAGYDQSDLTALQTQVQDLTSRNAELEALFSQSEREQQLETEAQQEREQAVGTPPAASEPEQPSGRLDIDWDVRTFSDDQGRLNSVYLSVNNGLDVVQELEYELYWKRLVMDAPRHALKESFVVQAASNYWQAIVSGGVGFPSYPSGGSDTLVLDIRDKDGSLLERFEREVR
jgi:hypothetical protein